MKKNLPREGRTLTNSARKFSSEKGDFVKDSPKIVAPPISEQVLELLLFRYSAPVEKVPDGPSAIIWGLTEELKGWLVKKTPNDPYGFRSVAWSKMKALLDEAVEQNDPGLFEEMARAWTKWNNPRLTQAQAPQVGKKGTPTPSTYKDSKAAEKFDLSVSIETLTHNSASNKANSPSKVLLINAIHDLQERLKRAPTRLELEMKTDIKKNTVSAWTKEFGISDLLSSKRRRPSAGS